MPLNRDEAVIDPRRAKREELLPQCCILVFTPHDIGFFLRCFGEQYRRSHKIFLADVYTGSVNGVNIAIAGPMMGAPQAVLVVEKLIALGVNKVIGVGWCGSLQPYLHIADLVLPDGAVSEEGTSAHYPLSIPHPGPSRELVDPLRSSFSTDGIKVHEGKVWSTDAPYRETAGKILELQEQGVLAVDMETSALFTLAHFRGIKLSMCLVVSDDLSSLKWKHGFREPAFIKNRERLALLTMKVVCSTIHSLA